MFHYPIKTYEKPLGHCEIIRNLLAPMPLVLHKRAKMVVQNLSFCFKEAYLRNIM
jgi:hypothetical protein